MSDTDTDTSDSDGNIPPAEECESRCQQFATVTNTDTALAMFYLQDRQWDLQKSLDAYFEDNRDPSASASSSAAEADTSGHGQRPSPSTEEPSIDDLKKDMLRVMSWNIDGLDTNNIINRAKAVCNQIKIDAPDIVLLQEVVQKSQTVLEQHCPEYQLIAAGTVGYYTAIMIHIQHTVIHNHTVTPFYSSKMARNLIELDATVKGVPLVVMTTHLESQHQHAVERKKQLQICFNTMKRVEQEKNVLFGGDLNLRDAELKELGGIPTGTVDVWEATGSRPEAKYTWDMQRNDNLEWNLGRKPRCRFDRLYYRPPTAKSTNVNHISPVYFELAGIQRLKMCKRFPSDHWGILAHFNVVKSLPK